MTNATTEADDERTVKWDAEQTAHLRERLAPTRDPRQKPQVGDRVVRDDGKSRTVTRRFGLDVHYVDGRGRTGMCFISTWRAWCVKSREGTS